MTLRNNPKRILVQTQLRNLTIPELEDAIADHNCPCDRESRRYMSELTASTTMARFTVCGSTLSRFNDYDEFINFCKAIHADEEAPKDYEGFMSEDDFDNSILEYSDICDKHGSDAVDDYMEFHDTLDSFEVIAQRLA